MRTFETWDEAARFAARYNHKVSRKDGQWTTVRKNMSTSAPKKKVKKSSLAKSNASGETIPIIFSADASAHYIAYSSSSGLRTVEKAPGNKTHVNEVEALAMAMKKALDLDIDNAVFCTDSQTLIQFIESSFGGDITDSHRKVGSLIDKANKAGLSWDFEKVKSHDYTDLSMKQLLHREADALCSNPNDAEFVPKRVSMEICRVLSAMDKY